MVMKKKGAAKGGVRKRRGGGMAKKGYAKGGKVAKMRGGGMATKGGAKGGAMTLAQLKAAAKRLGKQVV